MDSQNIAEISAIFTNRFLTTLIQFYLLPISFIPSSVLTSLQLFIWLPWHVSIGCPNFRPCFRDKKIAWHTDTIPRFLLRISGTGKTRTRYLFLFIFHVKENKSHSCVVDGDAPQIRPENSGMYLNLRANVSINSRQRNDLITSKWPTSQLKKRKYRNIDIYLPHNKQI